MSRYRYKSKYIKETRPPWAPYSTSIITAYIKNMNTKTVISFAAMLPETIQDSYSANYSPTDLLGRSSPIIGYSSGGPRSVSFDLTLHDDIIWADGHNQDIVDVVNSLKALPYPDYTSSKVIPPKCYVKIGDIISLVGVCNEVSVTWEKPYRETALGRMSYIKAEVSLSFDEVVVSPRGTRDIERGG